MMSNNNKLKAGYDYRFLGIWMALGNLIQFCTSLIGEDKIKSWWDGRVRAFLFIVAIPLLSFLFGKTKRALKVEKYIKENNVILNRAGNICFLLVFCFLLSNI